MYSTCLYCTKDLGTNEVIETLPIGRRIAFDARQGRLWVVCRSCAKWNLVPFDTRLETIDACERIFRDIRTRFSTDQIGLARVRDGLDLVRIGAPQRPEFAAWRYGAQYKRRRMQTIAMAMAGAAVGAGLLFGAASLSLLSSGVIGGLVVQVPRIGWQTVRAYRRRIVTNLPNSARASTLKQAEIQSAHLDLSRQEVLLRFRSPGASNGPATMSVSGIDARLLARRVAGVLNDAVGSGRQIDAAVGRLTAGSMEQWLREGADKAVIRKPGSTRAKVAPWERWPGFGLPALRIAALPAADRLALEMWFSEEDEARALHGELALLERQWKEADQLARIADSLALAEE